MSRTENGKIGGACLICCFKCAGYPQWRESERRLLGKNPASSSQEKSPERAKITASSAARASSPFFFTRERFPPPTSSRRFLSGAAEDASRHGAVIILRNIGDGATSRALIFGKTNVGARASPYALFARSAQKRCRLQTEFAILRLYDL